VLIDRRLRACGLQEHSLEQSVRFLDAMGGGGVVADGSGPAARVPLSHLLDNHSDRIFEYEAAVQHKVTDAVEAARRCARAEGGQPEEAREVMHELKRLSDLFTTEATKLNARGIRLAAEIAVACGNDAGDGGTPAIVRKTLGELDDCPDEELSLSIEAEAQELWQTFEARERALDAAYAGVVASGSGCGWTEGEHLWYLKVEQEYTESRAEEACKEANTTLRQLMLERMLLERPGLGRAALIDHEAQVAARRFYDKQRRYIARTADGEWAEFREHAVAALQEASVLREQRACDEEEREEFDRVRFQLKVRLLRWKRDKLAAAHEEERHRLAEEQVTAEWEEREAARVALERRVLKEKLQLHHEERERATALARAQEHRLASLRAEQAAKDAEVNADRVDYRRHTHENKLDELALTRQLEAEREAEREKRLERLRALVEVKAEIDSARTRGPTVASQAAAAAAEQHRHGIAARRRETRSFENHGFTRDHLDQDKRTRVEVALRAQGLVHTDYARDIMQKLAPPTAPRRGLDSSLFKST
jgi:hypothetical protein